MGIGQHISFALIIILILWLGYRYLGNAQVRKQAFTRESMSKSFLTLGVLALILIAVIVFCVYLLRIGS